MSDILNKLVEQEYNRQLNNIELIASENFVSDKVLELMGSVLTNKYAEGYPNARYYNGCHNVDEIESLGIRVACDLFNAQHANIQAHSGSSANMAVYMSILDYKDKVLAMDLNSGGHLTHGHSVSFSGKLYDFEFYNVDKDSELLDYDHIREIALRVRPKLIVAGASAYSREIDFKRFREIADEVGAYLMVDMAHIAGIVAGGYHNNPCLFADFVTSTTHKTLRGARGGIILCKSEFAKVIDKTVFPGIQGGPLMHQIAGKTQCLLEASESKFKDYIRDVLDNMRVLCDVLKSQGFRLVSGGSDNHLVIVDTFSSINVSGKVAADVLDSINITCNKNMIPFDSQKASVTSGIRLGSAAMTTRGFKKEEFIKVGMIIAKALKNWDNQVVLDELKDQVIELTNGYPLHK